MSLAMTQSTPRNGSESIAWSPQRGPQKALIDCPIHEIFYGGARGGGKTDGVLGKYGIKAGIYGAGFNALFFRKELPMLDDAIQRSMEIYSKVGAQWNEQKKTWRFPGGGRLRFRPLERAIDAEKYQGQNISDCCVEEAGNYPDPAPIDRLHGILRSASGVPTQLIMTGNPGGPGQSWIRERFIDPSPRGMKVIERALPNGATHKMVYIPSRLQNNAILMRNDPEYINRLHLVGSPELVRAWLEGDWSAIEGAYFDNWSTDRHVIKPFSIPKDWPRFRSGDWGSAKPFSIGWWAIVPDWFKSPDGVWLPRGAIVRYREWYGSRGPNKGMKLTAQELGKGIADRERLDPAMQDSVLDPAAFAEDGGPSLAERIYLGSAKTVKFRRADNKRVGKDGAMGGWDMMRQRLDGEDFGVPYGNRPMIYCFDTCIDSIRTIPMMQHDDKNPEDLDTKAEDHCFTGDTLVRTRSGVYPIADLIGKTGFTRSHDGEWHRFRSARLIKRNCPIVRLMFSDGSEITCTPDHRFLTSAGWTEAIRLQGQSILSLEQTPHRSLRARFITTAAADIIAPRASFYIGLCGRKIAGRSLMAGTSIIKTVIGITTRLKTWIVCQRLSTNPLNTAGSMVPEGSYTLNAPGLRQEPGTAVPKAEHGIASTIMSIARQPFSLKERSTAIIAGSPISRKAGANTVRGRAKQHGGGLLAWMTKNAHALSAEQDFGLINTLRPKHAPGSAGRYQAANQGPVCLSVKDAGASDVYCLTVPDTGNFELGNGLITAQCVDEWRYACMSRPYLKPAPEKVAPIKGIQSATLNELWATNKPEKKRI